VMIDTHERSRGRVRPPHVREVILNKVFANYDETLNAPSRGQIHPVTQRDVERPWREREQCARHSVRGQDVKKRILVRIELPNGNFLRACKGKTGCRTRMFRRYEKHGSLGVRA